MSIFSYVVNMNRLYFVLVRASARRCFSRYSFHPLPCENWSLLLNELKPMNPGRLLSFYYFMDQCESFIEQYRFHGVLCVMYPTHYPSVWWMFWQIIKSIWTSVSHQLF